jgi:hypothetical protein
VCKPNWPSRRHNRDIFVYRYRRIIPALWRELRDWHDSQGTKAREWGVGHLGHEYEESEEDIEGTKADINKAADSLTLNFVAYALLLLRLLTGSCHTSLVICLQCSLRMPVARRGYQSLFFDSFMYELGVFVVANLCNSFKPRHGQTGPRPIPASRAASSSVARLARC